MGSITNTVSLSNLKDIYSIKETGNPLMPYMLTGKRGATYGLMTQVDENGEPRDASRYPLFAVNSRGAVARLARYQTEWVTVDAA